MQVAKYDESYIVFFVNLTRTNGLVVEVSCSDSATWVQFLMSAETLCQPMAILHGTEPVSALTRKLFILLHSLFFFSWISSVAISR